MLLRLEPRGPRGLFAETQEQPDPVTELSKSTIIDGTFHCPRSGHKRLCLYRSAIRNL
jgi:hypothetical protein